MYPCLSASRNKISMGSLCCTTVSWASPRMIVIRLSTPAFLKFSSAILARSGSISCVKMWPSVDRSASANQTADSPVEVPISTTRFAPVASASSRKRRPSVVETLRYRGPLRISSMVARIFFSASFLGSGGASKAAASTPPPGRRPGRCARVVLVITATTVSAVTASATRFIGLLLNWY